jgi:hypothetical protein
VTIDQAIERVQFSYPQVYYACHTRRVRWRSNAFRLSARLEILVHPDRVTPDVSLLASHGPCSVHARGRDRTEALGYVAVDADDRRRIDR